MRRLLHCLLLVVGTASASCAHVGPVDIWSFSVVVAQGECLYDYRAAWGPAGPHTNLGNTRPKVCKWASGRIGFSTPMPEGPFTAQWFDEQRQPHDVSVDLRKVTRGFDVYGGRLIVELGNTSVKVYVAMSQIWLNV